METREWRYLDRKDWKSGRWDDEPDKKQWQDPLTGLPCLIVRGGSGAWCGYVGVAEGHPFFAVPYNGPDGEYGDKSPSHSCEVHGGLTFSDFCRPGEDEGRGICHLPGPGQPDHVWWLGFDCNHAWDLNPTYRFGYDGESCYRSMRYVESEVTGLALQLAEVQKTADSRRLRRIRRRSA